MEVQRPPARLAYRLHFRVRDHDGRQGCRRLLSSRAGSAIGSSWSRPQRKPANESLSRCADVAACILRGAEVGNLSEPAGAGPRNRRSLADPVAVDSGAAAVDLGDGSVLYARRPAGVRLLVRLLSAGFGGLAWGRLTRRFALASLDRLLRRLTALFAISSSLDFPRLLFSGSPLS